MLRKLKLKLTWGRWHALELGEESTMYPGLWLVEQMETIPVFLFFHSPFLFLATTLSSLWEMLVRLSTYASMIWIYIYVSSHYTGSLPFRLQEKTKQEHNWQQQRQVMSLRSQQNNFGTEIWKCYCPINSHWIFLWVNKLASICPSKRRGTCKNRGAST